MTEHEPLGRASFARLSPLVQPQPIPPPDRLWTADEWEAICRGFIAREMEDRWLAFVEDDRLFLHRSWTGYGVYVAQFAASGDGWRIHEAAVESDPALHGRGSDEYESLHLVYVIDRVLLDRWDEDLRQRLNQLR